MPAPATGNDWVLVLGASSGFGEATSIRLAKAGFHVAGVHLDRKQTMDNVQAAIKAAGREALYWNANAADPDTRKQVVQALVERCKGPDGRVRPLRVLFHSLAFGTLRPFIGTPEEQISQKQLEMTLDVMANSLVYWVQDLAGAGLLGTGSRVFAMTSAGGSRVWATYGAVSAAKAALEAHCRQLAVELAPRGISVNAIRAGVTDTPALRKIPGHLEMIAFHREHNPFHRLTLPEDVANVIALLTHPDTTWVTANVLGVDGGEFVV